MTMDTHSLLDEVGRADLHAEDIPHLAEVKRNPFGEPIPVPVLVDDRQVIIKDRGSFIVARVTHKDGSFTRYSSPNGVKFEHKGLNLKRGTTPKAAKAKRPFGGMLRPINIRLKDGTLHKVMP